MSTSETRGLRADAARNLDKILRAAREVWAEQGPDAHVEEIAARAGVGVATIYRRFPDKQDLARAAIDQGFTEDIVPVVDAALGDGDPWRGLVAVLEAAMATAAREANTLAVSKTGIAQATAPFFEALTELVGRGQRAGVIRDDLVEDDLPRIMTMLVSTLWTMEPQSDGWRRYVALVLDAISPTGASALPPVAPVLPHTVRR